MRAIVGVTEFKTEFTGMLNLQERFQFIYFNHALNYFACFSNGVNKHPGIYMYLGQ